LAIEGRLRTDSDLFEHLDRQMVYEPWAFAGLDLDRHRLSLDDEDHARFASAQKAIADGTSAPAFVRYRRARLDADRAMEAKGVDTDSPEARVVRANVRNQLDRFETIEGRAPVGADIDAVVAKYTVQVAPDSGNIVPAASGDLKCVGGDCQSGGDQGTTGMYSVGRATLCRKCAIKRLGMENEPAEEIRKALERFPR
jgi:hypothetical protein